MVASQFLFLRTFLGLLLLDAFSYLLFFFLLASSSYSILPASSSLTSPPLSCSSPPRPPPFPLGLSFVSLLTSTFCRSRHNRHVSRQSQGNVSFHDSFLFSSLTIVNFLHPLPNDLLPSPFLSSVTTTTCLLARLQTMDTTKATT